MKKIICCILFASLFTACKRDPSQLLVGRWSFSSFDVPGLRDFIDSVRYNDDADDITIKKTLLGDKLILRQDSSFDFVLFRQYIHGKWNYDTSSHNLFLKDVSANKFDVTVHVDSIYPNKLQFDMDEFTLNKLLWKHADDENGYHFLFNKPYCAFVLDADNEIYRNEKDDPYSKANNWWRMKPAQRETDDQIKQRVLAHLNFWETLFKDADNKQRAYVPFYWFASPLVIASYGAQMNYYEDAKQEWDQNFYDSVDAHKGYEYMRKCFSKKINYIESDDKYEKSGDIARQLKENYMNSFGLKDE